MRRPLIGATAIGLVAGALCLVIRVRNRDVGDFTWALYTAQAVLAGRDPYAFVPDANRIPYPLPVALFGLPLAWLPWGLAAAIFAGVSAAVLAWGILRKDEPWRLIVFASLPYFLALHFTQWSPLIMASWYLPVLAPLLVLIKPHTALPVAVLKLQWRGVLLAATVLGLSLLVDPTWPWRWAAMLGTYQRTIPITALPAGPLLALAAVRWRDPRARLLLLMAILPLRNLYDLSLLWLIPATRRQALALTVASWAMLPFLGKVSAPAPSSVVQVIYLVALAIVLLPFATRRARWATVPAPTAAENGVAASERPA